MRMWQRSLVFDGVDICERFGLHYSTFEEQLPEKKLITISIPYGADLDITERLGRGGWTNGTHTLKFLLYGVTESERLRLKNEIINLIQGRRAEYSLTWDPDYTYTGRAKMSIEHRAENVDVITIDIDRYPWRHSIVEDVVDLVGEMTATSSTPQVTDYEFLSHRRYHDVRVTAQTDVKGKWSTDGTWVHYGLNGATDELVAEDVWDGDGTYQFTLNSLSDWLMRVDEDAQKLIVNSSRLTVSGSDATVTNATYTITDGNIEFAGLEKQYVTLRYEAWDI